MALKVFSWHQLKRITPMLGHLGAKLKILVPFGQGAQNLTWPSWNPSFSEHWFSFNSKIHFLPTVTLPLKRSEQLATSTHSPGNTMGAVTHFIYIFCNISRCKCYLTSMLSFFPQRTEEYFDSIKATPQLFPDSTLNTLWKNPSCDSVFTAE